MHDIQDYITEKLLIIFLKERNYVIEKIYEKFNSNNSKLTFQLVDKYINQIKLYEQGKIDIEFKD